MSAPARARLTGHAALREIQRPIRGRLEGVPEELARIVAVDLPRMEEVKSYLLLMQGKMFRPTLVLLSSETGQASEPARALTLSAIVEIIHLATLVHDDAVDHSVLRRGMPTINAAFSHQVAVIMGDFLYLRALAELVGRGEHEALSVMTRASQQMTVGEMRQLMAHDTLAFSEQDYYALIASKTASLMSAACEMGALCGNIGYRRELARYGERLGMAFQIADDLLDYTADAEEMGKPTGLDLREHKVTLPLIAALPTMTAAERSVVDKLFSEAEPDDRDIATVVEIVSDRGGLEYARRRGDEFARDAEAALAALPETEARTALLDAIAYVLERRN